MTDTERADKARHEIERQIMPTPDNPDLRETHEQHLRQLCLAVIEGDLIANEKRKDEFWKEWAQMALSKLTRRTAAGSEVTLAWNPGDPITKGILVGGRDRLISSMDATVARAVEHAKGQARPLGNRFIVIDSEIVKIANGEILPLEEPLFLLRARDHLAVPWLLQYRQLCVLDGCNDYILGLLDEMIDKFREFSAQHPGRMKQPGVTRGK
jgi:hypothetical protein